MSDWIRGSCHCGTVVFEVRLVGGLEAARAGARRCDCSLCLRRGAVTVSAPMDGLRVLEGEEALTLYRFGTGVAEHHFCARCGIYTHHKRRSNPDEYGVNFACLEGQTPLQPEVIVHDGVNHPTDTGVSRIAGRLRYEREEER